MYIYDYTVGIMITGCVGYVKWFALTYSIGVESIGVIAVLYLKIIASG